MEKVKKVVHFGCCDDRMPDALNELKKRENLKIYSVQFPGGIRYLVERFDIYLSQPYIHSSKRLIEMGAEQILISLHGGGCGGYSDVEKTSEEMEKLHIMHLALAREKFRQFHPEIPIRLFYARPKPGDVDTLRLGELLL